MKKLALPAALCVALFSAPAFAGTVTLDFETAPSFGSIDALYAAVGVNFGPDAQGLQNDALGPYFSNAPSPVGVMFVSGANATLNVDAGFYGLGFYYSSADAVADALQVWSELDGNGTLLASFSLQNNATLGCNDSAYCHWDFLGSSWSSAARSVTFAAGTQLAAFDNVSMVPEPASGLLAALALSALLLCRRSR